MSLHQYIPKDPRRKPSKAEVDAALESARKNNAIENIFITDEEFAQARIAAHLKHRGVSPETPDEPSGE